MGLTQGPIFQGPEFRGPEIKPRQTWLEKFAAGVASTSPQVKAASITFIGMLLLTLVSSTIQCSRVSTQNLLLQHDKENLQSKLREQDSAILKLTTEKASAENRAATFEAIPSQVPSLISNVSNLIAKDPTNRQQLLGILFAIQSLTNALTEVTLKPTFDLFINGIRITNNTVLDLKRTRTMSIEALNTSPISAEQLSISFSAPFGLDPTNLLADQWILMPKVRLVLSDTGRNSPIANRWLWRADHLAASGEHYFAASLRFSTNFTYPVIVVQFGIYAARAKTVTYNVSLTF